MTARCNAGRVVVDDIDVDVAIAGLVRIVAGERTLSRCGDSKVVTDEERGRRRSLLTAKERRLGESRLGPGGALVVAVGVVCVDERLLLIDV
jgi:hypothetical protein